MKKQNKKKNKSSNTKKYIIAIAALLVIIVAVVLVTKAGNSKLSIPDEYQYSDMSEYITVGDYKNVHYDKETASVTDDELQTEIADLLDSYTTTEQQTSGTVESDSVVNIDYVGKLNGEAFDGGTAEGQTLDIANSNYIDGFAEGIIGHEVGSTFDINVTFPESYAAEELAGQPAVFTITVNSIEVKTTPELTDKWVKNNTDYSSVDDFNSGIKKELLEQKKKQIEANARNAVFSSILENSELKKYPATELNNRKEQYSNLCKQDASSKGQDFDTYVTENYGSAKAFKKMNTKLAKSNVKGEMVLVVIAEKEGIEITDSEYSDYVMGIINDAGYDEDSFEEQTGMSIQEYAENNSLYYELLYTKVMDKVMKYSIAD